MVNVPASKPKRDRRPGMARRLLVRCSLVLVMLVVLVCVFASLLLTPVAGLVLRPKLEAQLGVRVEGGTLRLDTSGDILLKNVDFLTPHADNAPKGQAARFLTVRDGRIMLGWRGSARGQPLVRRIDIFNAQVRLSKPLEEFDLNILAIDPPQGAGAAVGVLPGIVVHQADIVLGEHDAAGDISVLRSLPITASLRSSRDRPGTYDVTALEIASQSTSVRPLRFEGNLGPDGFSGRLGAFDMADFPPEAIPRQLREFYRELAVGGRARGATLRYDQISDVLEVSLDVQAHTPEPAPFPDDSMVNARLDLRLPVPTDETGTLRPLIPASGSGKVRLVQRPTPGQGRDVAWRGVQAANEPGETGLGRRTIMLEASLDSTIEDARVRLDARVWLGGGEPLYEFTVGTLEPYTLGPQTPWLHRPSPVIDKIREVLAKFEPAGTVELNARVSQVADGVGVRQRVVGTGQIRDATVRYEHFPYPAGDITGDIVFDDGQIRIENIKGKTTGDGVALATVTITIDQAATGVDIDILAFNVPYDDTMRRTLDEVAPEIREIALNEDAYRGLIQNGIVRQPGSPGRLPAFAMGGEVGAQVRVRRQAGVEGSTWVEVVARTQNFGFVPESFAMPIIARDVELRVFLPSERDTITLGKPRTLRVWAENVWATSMAGGDIGVRLDVGVPIEDDSRTTIVDLEIRASSLPVHQALLAAVPEGEAATGPAQILRALQPTGEIDATVRVTRDHEGHVDWWTEVVPKGLSLLPVPLDARHALVLDRVSGFARVDARGLRADLGAQPRHGGSIRANIRSDFGDGSVLVLFTSEGLNLATPVEDAIAVVAPELARSLVEMRDLYRISGSADVSASVRVTGGEPSAEVRIARLHELRFDWLGGRMGMDHGRGSIVVSTTNEGPLISFDRVVAEGSYQSAPIGRVRLRGELPVDALREGGSFLTRPTRMEIELQGGSLGSPFLRMLAGERGGNGLSTFLEEHDPQGEYDAMVGLETASYGEGPMGQKPMRRFELSPYEISILRDGRRVEVPWVSGLLTGRELVPSPTGPGGATTYAGLLDNLTFGGDGWWVSLDGGWSADGQGGILLDTKLEGLWREADASIDEHPLGVPGPMLALASPAIADALVGMAFKNIGGISMEDGRLRVRSRPGHPLSIEAGAPLAFDHFEVGRRSMREGDQTTVPMANLRDSVLDIRTSTANPDSMATLHLRSLGGAVWGLDTSAVEVHADVGRDGTVELPRIIAGSGGGRLAGRGRVAQGRTPEEPLRYEFNLDGAGLHTEWIIAAVQDRPSKDEYGSGDLDLSMGLAGAFGDPQSIRGRGSLRIRGGSPVDLPLPIRATVEALNVTFGADRYDAVNGEFYIDGPVMTFTRLAVSSDSVVLDGIGTVDLEGGQLNMRLSTRPTSDTVLRALVRFLREVIVAVELRGTLDSPSPAPRPQALVGPLDALRRFIQGGLTYDEWQMERLKRFAREHDEPRSGW